jgi:peptidoglycan endopeptidase LytE
LLFSSKKVKKLPVFCFFFDEKLIHNTIFELKLQGVEWMKILGSLTLLVCFAGLTGLSFGQVFTRPRIVPVQNPSVKPSIIVSQDSPSEDAKSSENRTSNRPPFLQDIVIVNQKTQPLVQKTSSVSPSVKAGSVEVLPKNSIYGLQTTQLLLNSIRSKLGIPYRYGADGPNYYDCSGFIWSVFRDAGIDFERTSAKTLWEMSEPVPESEKYKFGTLVFFNRLGHVGIVADENGFYHASRSKGIVYSRFDSYWRKRIVGFRRLKTFQTSKPQLDNTNREIQRETLRENKIIIR